MGKNRAHEIRIKKWRLANAGLLFWLTVYDAGQELSRRKYPQHIM